MDPNAILAALRRLVEDQKNAEEAPFELQEFVEGFDALDGWLSAGGFLPGSWQR